MAEGNIYRATIESHYSDSGVRVNNVLWFRQLPGGPDAIEESSLGQSIRSVLQPSDPGGPGAMRILQANTYVYDAVRVQRMTPGLPGGAVLTVLDFAGGSSDLALPTFTSLDLKLQSTMIHARGRGRLYLGGFCRSNGSIPGQASSSRWHTNLINRVLQFADAFHDRFDEATVDNEGFEWGVWSKTIAGRFPPFNDGAFHPLADFTVDPIMRCQRRREEAVGY